MRKRLILPLLMILLSPISTWPTTVATVVPRKGDTVYVSAPLSRNYVFYTRERVDPCIPLEIKQANAEKENWLVHAGVKHYKFRLLGPWLERMHETESQCEEFFEEHGPPRVLLRYNKHTIIPPQPEPVTEEEEEAP